MASDDGIFVNVLPELDLLALAAVVSNMKRIFGGVGKDISAAFDASRVSVTDLERTMIDSANRSSAAQIRAAKAAADAQIAEGERASKVLAAQQSFRESAQIAAQTAIQNSMVMAQKQKEAHGEADAAQKEATETSKAYADAAGASAAATMKAFDGIGKASALATAAIVGSTTSIAGNWETMMTRIQVAGQVPAGQIADLSNHLLQLSSSMGVSQKEIANASLMLSKAGDQYKDTATQVTILKAAIELAKTEGADLTNTVQQMTSSMTDFQIPTSQAAQLATQIQIAASNAKRPLDEFLGSLHNVESNAGRVLDKDTGLPQLLTVMSQMASQGAGMDQVTQNLNNFLNHLNDFNSPQRSILGAIGLDSTDLAEQLKQPNGLITVLGELRTALQGVTTGTGDDAMVHLGMAYRNPQVTADMSRLYGQLNAQQKLAADQLLKANQAGVDISPADYRTVRAAKASGGDFPTWYNDFLKTTGPQDLIKQGLPPDLPLSMVQNKLGGTDAAGRSFAGLMGNPADPSDTRWQETQDRYRNVTNARPDSQGNIPGWDAVAKTWQNQLSIFKASVEQLGEAVGEKFLPTLKKWLDDITGFVNFLNGHQGALSTVLHTIETIAEIWASQKLISGLTNFSTKLTSLGGAGGDAEKAATGLGKVQSGLSKVGGVATVVAAALEAAKYAEDELEDKLHLKQGQGTDSPMNHFLIEHGMGFLVPSFDRHPDNTKPNANGYDDLTKFGPSTGPHRSTPIGASGAGDVPQLPGTPGAPGPAGTQGDPLFTQPAATPNAPDIPGGIAGLLGGGGLGDDDGGGLGGGSTLGAKYDPFKDMGKGGVKGLVPQLAQLAGTFLAELAVGNPYGKMHGAGGDDDASGGGGLGDLPSADAIEKMSPAELKSMEGTIRLRKAILNYKKALRTYAKAIQQYGSNSEQGANALDSLLEAKDSVEGEVGNEQAAYGSAQQVLAQDNQNGLSLSDPARYAKDQAAAASQPGYTKVGGSTGGYSTSAASEIIKQGQAHGWNRDQIVAALSTGMQESGLSESANGGGGAWHGIFQQDGSYPGRDDMASNVKAFFDRQGTPTGDAWNQIFALQQGRPYDAPGARQGYMSEIQRHTTDASRLYDQLAPAAGSAGPPGASSPGGGLLGALKQAFSGGGGGGSLLGGFGESPVFKRDGGASGSPGTTMQYGPPVPGQGLEWGGPGLGWVRNGGLGLPLGTRPNAPSAAPGADPTNLFAPGGLLGGNAPGPKVGPQPMPAASPGPSSGAGAGAPAGPPAQSQPTGQGNGPGASLGNGGLIGGLESAAASAADAFAPGSGAGIQLAMQEANRFAGYVGQVAGIAAEGAIDFFHVSDPDGGKVGSGKNWLDKIAGGIGGSHNSLGNGAGAALSAPGLKPGDNKNAQSGQQGDPGGNVNVTNNFHGTNDNADKVNQTINQGFMMNPGGGL